jgi:hypothetical protein
MHWHTHSRLAPLAAAAFAVAFAAAACSSAAATPSPSPAMVESPSPAMMEHSPSPSPAMMEHSPSPSPAMASHPAPVSMGTFHAVDGTATGTAALFHQPDGTFVVTFEGFSIASAAHTDVILVPNKDVKSDGDITKASIVDLGPLKGTSGMQDFAVPASASAMTYHAVVLWDTQMSHAIAAAPLQ